MPKVKLYQPVEGDAEVGDVVEVDQARANFLVVGGYATYASASDAEGGHVRPVGGARAKGTKAGVEPSAAVKEKLLTPPTSRDKQVEIQTLEEENADKPDPSEPPTSDNYGPMVDHGTGKVEKKAARSGR